MNKVSLEALRGWFIPVVVIGIVLVMSLLLCRFAGILSPEPLIQTRPVLALSWGLTVAFVLQFVLTWRDHRRYFLTETLLRNTLETGSPALSEPTDAMGQEVLIRWGVTQALKRRCAVMLGDVTASLGMLAGLYVITKLGWLLAAILVYSDVAAWVFRPRDRELPSR